MRRRAEQVDQTRQRIVEATVHLHGTVGPAATSVAAIAEQAGVTRLTVYRHFPDEAELLTACTAHWMSQRRVPDPGAWAGLSDPVERLRAGLTDLYRFYRDGEPMLTRVYRDLAALPGQHRRLVHDTDRHHREVLVAPFPPTTDLRILTTAVGHAASFTTWRTLCVDHDLTDLEAVHLMAALVEQVSMGGQEVVVPR